MSWLATRIRSNTITRWYSRNSLTSLNCLFGLRGWLAVAKVGLDVTCCTSLAFAVAPNRTLSQYVHDSWGVDRGFPNETVTSIAQTPDGYLWIGTDKSLIRFDGLNFQKFQQAVPTSFTISAVQTLVSDAQGNLWILLPTTKLLRYHDGNFDVVRGKAENGITAIGTGTGHTIWVSSLAMGILSYNGTDFVSLSSLNLSAKTETFPSGTIPPWSTPAWPTPAWST